MEDHYFYQCTQCGHQLAAETAQEAFVYLCPHCGKAEKNEPLQGVLQIEYDYQAVRKTLTRERFLSLPAGVFWLYPQLWPLHYDLRSLALKEIDARLLNNLRLPSNSLLTLPWQGQTLLLMDETRNPTFSFKDRATILVVLKALQTGIGQIAAASTGNAGSSLAGICARAGLQAQIWVPSAIPAAKLLQIRAYGAQIHKVAGDYDLAFDRSLEVSRANGWYNRNTAYNPLTIEGKKSAAFDLFLQTSGKLPSIIFVPVGDGVIISGLYKGLRELQRLDWIDQLPQLIGVQAAGSDALVRFLENGRFEFKAAHTLADSISAGAPRNLYLAAKAIRETNGKAIAVTDGEILAAQRMLACSFGVLAEPAAAAAMAGLLKWQRENPVSGTPLVWITGNGLKDVEALKLSLAQ